MSSVAWSEILGSLIARRDLDDAQVEAAFDDMIQARCGEAEAAAFLVGLRMKGETAAEIAAAARVLRRHMVRWSPGCEVLDTCGTGGDGSGTLNISTAAAIVVAGTGVKVVKHGNRSVSSKSGSADVLAALGVHIEGDAGFARLCLDRAGLAFCFAPLFHPALKHVGAVRRRLGVPTIFNCLGPLANPAGAQRQLLGVGRRELLDLMSAALAHLGTARALVVCSQDGLDEVSLSAPTLVREVRGGEVRALEWTPADFGLGEVSLPLLAAADAQESARRILAILHGETSPAALVVIANAAAALMAAERCDNLREGVSLATKSLQSGSALGALETLRGLRPTT